MNIEITVRREMNADIDAITDVTIAAFNTLEISNHTEQFIIEALRASNALAISLVAEVDGCVAGHIAFSPVTISDGTRGWYGLGPVSVLPDHQRVGIGTALIRAGLAQLRELHACGCCLVGHPEYYKKLVLITFRILFLRESPRRFFSSCLLMEMSPRGRSPSMKDSRRIILTFARDEFHLKNRILVTELS